MSDTIEPTDAERAALARAITRANGVAREHDDRFPVTAAVLKDDEVVAWGDNEVHVDHDPSRHAEIVAIANACAELGGRDALKGGALVTTLHPCEMCLAAIRIAGITRVVFAATREATEGRYAWFEGLAIDDFRDACGAAFDHAGGVMQADVLRLYMTGTSGRED